MTFVLPNWRLIAFSICFFSLFVFLGVWQYNRVGEKEQMLLQAAQHSDLPGKILTPGLELHIGEPVRARGAFDAEFALLADNKVLEGRVGYEVVQLFRTTSGVNVLVNRGFIAGGRTRTEIPVVPEPLQSEQNIRGHMYLSELAVPKQNTSGSDFPIVTQVVNPNVLQRELGEELYPMVLRLEADHQDALPRHWPVTTIPPERHMGYAITWFTMALAIALAMGFSSFRRVKIEP
jgi:surfeit locus 1 family protein